MESRRITGRSPLAAKSSCSTMSALPPTQVGAHHLEWYHTNKFPNPKFEFRALTKWLAFISHDIAVLWPHWMSRSYLAVTLILIATPREVAGPHNSNGGGALITFRSSELVLRASQKTFIMLMSFITIKLTYRPHIWYGKGGVSVTMTGYNLWSRTLRRASMAQATSASQLFCVAPIRLRFFLQSMARFVRFRSFDNCK